MDSEQQEWAELGAGLSDATLGLITEKLREQLESDRPRKADYVEGAVVLREELAPPSVPPLFGQAVLRAYRSHKISGSRALELLRGTLTPAQLPPVNKVPVEAMRAELEPV